MYLWRAEYCSQVVLLVSKVVGGHLMVQEVAQTSVRFGHQKGIGRVETRHETLIFRELLHLLPAHAHLFPHHGNLESL